MAITSGFFNSLNGDRKYDATQFSALFNNLITDGVFMNVGSTFEVKASGAAAVTVGVGRAWFNGIWVYNDALYPMAVREAEVVLDRIDAIVIEIDHNEAVRTGTIRWVYGTPSSKPSKPALTTLENVYQYPIAYVYRHAGSTSISQSDIENAVGTSQCPYVTGILKVNSIDNIVAQWESEFSIWFDSLDATLAGDVAANLANQTYDLYKKFNELAQYRSVYTDLTDSSGDAILDSNGGTIEGSTRFDTQEAGNTIIINNETSIEESHKVGDILTTIRPDLDSKWIKCDGALIPTTYEYAELRSIVGSDILKDMQRLTSFGSFELSLWYGDCSIGSNYFSLFYGNDNKYHVLYVKDGVIKDVTTFLKSDFPNWSSYSEYGVTPEFRGIAVDESKIYLFLVGRQASLAGGHTEIFRVETEYDSYGIKDNWSNVSIIIDANVSDDWVLMDEMKVVQTGETVYIFATGWTENSKEYKKYYKASSPGGAFTNIYSVDGASIDEPTSTIYHAIANGNTFVVVSFSKDGQYACIEASNDGGSTIKEVKRSGASTGNTFAGAVIVDPSTAFIVFARSPGGASYSDVNYYSFKNSTSTLVKSSTYSDGEYPINMWMCKRTVYSVFNGALHSVDPTTATWTEVGPMSSVLDPLVMYDCGEFWAGRMYFYGSRTPLVSISGANTYIKAY